MAKIGRTKLKNFILLGQAAAEAQDGLIFIIPNEGGFLSPEAEISAALPIKRRREKALKNLRRAKEKLKKIKL